MASSVSKRPDGLPLRLASSDDIPEIVQVGRSATGKYGSIPELADLAGGDETPEKVQKWLDQGRIYISPAEDGRIAGFVAAHCADDVLFTAEISVHPGHQGKGVGNKLLDAVFAWARESAEKNGEPTARVSLTAYADVPWTGPWYTKRGFREVQAKTLGPWHVEKMRNDEHERGLVRPGYRRCCMLWETEV